MSHSADISALGECQQWRVLVENTPGIWRYIAKIVPYGKADGGFAVVPAYPKRGGAIVKIRLKDTFSHFVHPTGGSVVDSRNVTNRVKLSFHPDGVTQISGADDYGTVTSGLDQSTGAFKGMGVHGRPFSRPVTSGSVFSMTAWGLAFYPKTTTEKKTIRFSSLDLGKQGLIGRSAVLLQGFLIHRSEPVEVINVGGQVRVRSVRWNGHTGRREAMELRVCNLYNDQSYLALRCFRQSNPKVERNPSGYMLNSQRGMNDDTGLHALFPAPSRAAPFYKTLDRGVIMPKLILPPGES